MFDFFCQDEDRKKLMGDSTVIRAHTGAAGAPVPGQVFPAPQHMGRSKGCFSTKINLLISCYGKPQRLILTPGQVGDAS
ncbi:MAG: hypothetical protein QG599_3003 [Pseudomonadota bacterium]|nr:hypothetical protein [Pseudomonadota bacterium]